MGYLGRRIGLSQGQGNSNPVGADGAVGGGVLNLFAHGYFNREGSLEPEVKGFGASGGTCLLYTSPSPRDVEESRMPSSA